MSKPTQFSHCLFLFFSHFCEDGIAPCCDCRPVVSTPSFFSGPYRKTLDDQQAETIQHIHYSQGALIANQSCRNLGPATKASGGSRRHIQIHTRHPPTPEPAGTQHPQIHSRREHQQPSTKEQILCWKYILCYLRGFFFIIQPPWEQS